MRLQVVGNGTTTLKVKLWGAVANPARGPCPRLDSTAVLQAAGGVGVSTYVSGTSTNLPLVYSFDNLVVPAP